MKHRLLRDVSKFLAGFVLADFLTLCSFSINNMLPIHFFGLIWTPAVLAPGLLFDAAAFLILVHYGWNLGKIPRFRERTYLMIAGIIFGIVALIHLTRLFTGAISIDVFGWIVPLWLSWLGAILAAYLSYISFCLVVKFPSK